MKIFDETAINVRDLDNAYHEHHEIAIRLSQRKAKIFWALLQATNSSSGSGMLQRVRYFLIITYRSIIASVSFRKSFDILQVYLEYDLRAFIHNNEKSDSIIWLRTAEKVRSRK